MDSLDANRFPELSLFMNEDKSDVVFVIDGHRVPALKDVLKLKSPVFNAMFSGNFKESIERVIIVEDTTYEAFKAMVFLIYTEQLLIEDEDNFQLVSDLCKLIDKYQMLRLFDVIDRHYESKITVNNIEHISGFAFEYRMEKSMAEVMNVIENDFNVVMSKPMETLKIIDGQTNQFLFQTLAKKWCQIFT